MVYKLVAVADTPDGPPHPVAKRSHDKISVGGRKTAYRRYDGDVLVAEGYRTDGRVPDGAVPVHVPLVRAGELVHTPSLAEVREHAAAALAALPASALAVAAGPPYLTATHDGPEEGDRR